MSANNIKEMLKQGGINMKLVPLGDRVVLKQIVAEETTKSGIVLPGQSKEKPQQAEAWQFGPVIRQVYYYFCGNGAMPIISKYDTVIDKSDRCHVDPIVEEKRKLDPWDLVEDTHKQGRAWSKVFNHGQGNKHIIDNDLIRRLG